MFIYSDGVDYQYQTVAAQLFASPVAMTILGSALEEVCHSRLVFCRDLLILLCVLKYNSVYEVILYSSFRKSTIIIITIIVIIVQSRDVFV
jgi:hypothetical protein